ncbi:MAG: transcription elongation factor GreA [Candidatus Dojkabacteria bacterium]|jgi:transcription elongation factor GreA|nr:MAG: transcription elongation factor GreA [Candidatus Dojkabacteria bacterium]
MSEKHTLTKEGYESLKKELERLKTEVRQEIAAKLAEAASYGDLSENAAYQAAVEMRDINENRIAELEEILANAKIVRPRTSSKKDVVSIGSKVKLRQENGKEIEFEIVGKGETDLALKKFNVDSPLGSAVLGKKKGDEVEIELPSGKFKYKIISVS